MRNIAITLILILIIIGVFSYLITYESYSPDIVGSYPYYNPDYDAEPKEFDPQWEVKKSELRYPPDILDPDRHGFQYPRKWAYEIAEKEVPRGCYQVAPQLRRRPPKVY